MRRGQRPPAHCTICGQPVRRLRSGKWAHKADGLPYSSTPRPHLAEAEDEDEPSEARPAKDDGR